MYLSTVLKYFYLSTFPTLDARRPQLHAVSTWLAGLCQAPSGVHRLISVITLHI